MTTRQLTLLRTAAGVLGTLPEGSGQHRAVRLLYYRVIKPHERSEVVNARLKNGGGEIALDLRDFVQAQAFLTRRYDSELVEFVLSRLRPGSLVLDVGAHIGMVAIQLAIRCRGATIHAFEPFPENAAALRANVARNGLANVIVNQAAASDSSTTLNLAVAGEGSNWHYLDASADGIPVPSITLDSYARMAKLGRIDVLKLDVEGHELPALRGASGLLAEGRIDTVVTEVHEHFRARGGEEGVGDLLEPLGYEMSEIPGLGLHRFRRPSNVYRNVYFERPGRSGVRHGTG